ncbi:nucleoside 2-deoxyribosyltransferase [Roseospira visakhapatnamensis]|uniref:Nucleoside 2-deoxyribosyltransferase n=1 Tax=Roseospira visakhapatnamensis TaxID=390880 RepID=A0A7W6RDV1_9PROT|nr:nucleoside 2-deoxyribosyltransferase [Roseospira visakhapatnamensis]MBB4266739.1 nucleoside 2-deoxyribosyltransferase [Roseospira visakhapatnamensis]
MTRPQPRIYLAGPEVFRVDARAIGERKRALCAESGLEGVFPLDGVPPGEPPPTPDSGLAIARHCFAALDRCDAMIANITPFRSPSGDVGTAVEMGYMRGLGRPVVAYSNTALPYVERVAIAIGGGLPKREDGTPVDLEDMAVESFGLADNLMVDGCAASEPRGAPVITRQTPFAARWTDLTAFTEAVRLLAARLG